MLRTIRRLRRLRRFRRHVDQTTRGAFRGWDETHPRRASWAQNLTPFLRVSLRTLVQPGMLTPDIRRALSFGWAPLSSGMYLAPRVGVHTLTGHGVARHARPRSGCTREHWGSRRSG